MVKGQEIIEGLSFKFPTLDRVETEALEIYFVDRQGMIHGRYGRDVIRWGSDGTCWSLPKFTLVKVKWYDIPSNFPCLVKDLEENCMVATHSDKRFIYTECCVFDKTKAIPATLEEVTKLIIKEGIK